MKFGTIWTRCGVDALYPRPIGRGGSMRASSRTRQRQTNCEGLRGLVGSNEREDCGRVQFDCAALVDNWTTAQAHVGTNIVDAGDWMLATKRGTRRWRKAPGKKSWRAERRTGCGKRGGRGMQCQYRIFISEAAHLEEQRVLSPTDDQGNP